MAYRWGFGKSAVVLALALAGCVWDGTPGSVSNQATAPEKTAGVAAARPENAPIDFAKVSFNLRRGDLIGRWAPGPFFFAHLGCGTRSNKNVVWSGGRLTTDENEFADMFRDAMMDARFDVVGNPDRLFDIEDDLDRVAFQIGAVVTPFDLVLCEDVDINLKPTGLISGTAKVRVTWQVYSTLERRVVHQVETKGASETPPDGTFDGHVVLILNAFHNAAERLAVEPSFRKAVAKRMGATVAAASVRPVAAGAPVDLPRLAAFAGAIDTGRWQHVRNATVTIPTGGGGHGSGFVIAEDGWIMTDQHVVGEAEQVPVVFASGLRIAGRVMRRDKVRDVALVKVSVAGLKAIPIRRGGVVVGEAVYAVGTPLRQDLQATVTMGIVSAMRRDQGSGLEHIQADVDIHGGSSGGLLLDGAGNVVGITVAGYGSGAGQTSIGLNLFIPIDDALERLALRLAKPPA